MSFAGAFRSGATPAPDGHVPGTNLIVKKHSSRSPSPTQPKHDQSDRRRDGGRDNRREQEEERIKEREFRERERRWEDRERQLARERARDKERLTREADRAIEVGERTEQMLLEEDEDVEDMRRGALEDRQRRRKVRRRLREQELRDDAEDERRERAEEEQAKLQAEQAASGKQAAAASVSQAPPQRSPERPTASRPQHQSSAAAGPMMMGPVGPSLGAVGPSMPGASSPQAASGPAISMKAVAVSKPKAKTEAKVDRKPKNAAFAVEEDTGEIKRKLVKLDYGADAPSTGAAQAARSAAAAAAAMINQRRARGGESAADRAKRLCVCLPRVAHLDFSGLLTCEDTALCITSILLTKFVAVRLVYRLSSAAGLLACQKRRKTSMHCLWIGRCSSSRQQLRKRCNPGLPRRLPNISERRTKP